jgi:hypothetical protein
MLLPARSAGFRIMSLLQRNHAMQWMGQQTISPVAILERSDDQNRDFSDGCHNFRDFRKVGTTAFNLLGFSLAV